MSNQTEPIDADGIRETHTDGLDVRGTDTGSTARVACRCTGRRAGSTRTAPLTLSRGEWSLTVD
ncbi:hypothetical protein ACQEVY_33055 [Streptomyces sp. CA-288835]|uniref:hypothetical protein n=1 Tax=Streptomyces sp. CA-288835 TaxID=3240069 RepID=UPI003D8EF13F